jgi:hypothetical protein
MKNLNSTSNGLRAVDVPMTSPVRISNRDGYDEEDFEEPPEWSTTPTSLYSNMTVVAVTKNAWQEKGVWTSSDLEPGPASSSGTFSRLFKSHVHRKPERASPGRPEPHGITLNLHQFHTDNGDSLGEDPDSWARLTF